MLVRRVQISGNNNWCVCVCYISVDGSKSVLSGILEHKKEEEKSDYMKLHNEDLHRLSSPTLQQKLQGGSNMTGTNCDLFTRN